MRSLWTAAAVVFAVACGGSHGPAEDDEDGNFGNVSEGELRGRTLSIPAGGSKDFTFNTTGASAVTVSIDCNVPENPDEVGTRIKVRGLSIHMSSARAGYYAWSGNVDEGDHTVTIESEDGGRCTIKVGPTDGSCKTFEAARSPNTNHNHYAVGQDSADDWEPFPASGNHWGAWAQWNKAYEKPVKRPFFMHNLEHGGAVLSYKCSSNSSAECQERETKLKSLASGMNLSRYLITPDPEQPEEFAVRTWRMTWSSTCLNEAAAKSFIRDNIRHGREDIDADPPMPFDPTTTEVPCQDLMAAPDSCF